MKAIKLKFINNNKSMLILIGLFMVLSAYTFNLMSKNNFVINKITLFEKNTEELKSQLSIKSKIIEQILPKIETLDKRIIGFESEITSLNKKLDKLEEDFIYSTGVLTIDDIESIKININDIQMDIDKIVDKQEEQNKTIEILLNKKRAFSENIESKLIPLKSKFPYNLINIEYRSGQSFAVIAPLKFNNIDQLILVSKDEMVNNWRLTKIDKTSVTFSNSEGQTQTLKMVTQ